MFFKGFKRAVLSFLICILLSMVFPVMTFAMKEAKTVRVGYALMERFQEGADGEYKTGYGYEYLQHIANRTGWHYEYVYGSEEELYEQLKEGSIDLMGYLHYSPERDSEVIFANLPQGKECYYIYTAKPLYSDREYFFRMIDALRIGVLEGTPQRPVLEKWLKNRELSCNIKVFKDEDSMYRALDKGDIAGLVSSDFSSRDGYKHNEHIGYGDFYLAVSDKSPALANELNEALKDMMDEDRYINASLYSKYYSCRDENTEFNNQELMWLKNHDYTIKLGYLKNNLPYSDQSETGEIAGVIAKLASAFSVDFGVNIIAVGYDTHDELIQAAMKREIDVYGPIYEDFYASEIDGILNTSPIVSTTLMLLHKDPECFDHNLTIAYEKDNAIQYKVMNVLYPDSVYVKYKDKASCLKAIDRGIADCMLLSMATINIYKQYAVFDKLYVTEFDDKIDVCMGVNEGRAELLSIVNRVIRSEKDKLMGAALIESSYIERTPTFEEVIRANAFKVASILIAIIVALIAFLVYFWRTTATIIQMKNNNERLFIQAFRDELTMTGNRASYLAEIEKINADIKAGAAEPFKIIVVDVNGLKIINDCFGHDTGDRLIINAGRALSRLFEFSPVYRIGGDEFVVLPRAEDFSNTELQISKLEQLNALELTKELVEKGGFSLSFGIAEYNPIKNHSFKDVFEKADAEMYRYKNEFKKRFVVKT